MKREDLIPYFVAEAHELISRLTEQEREVMILGCKGLGTVEIGEQVGRGKTVIERLKTNAYRQMQVGTMAEAAVLLTKAGYL